jgi:hypothetical protein
MGTKITNNVPKESLPRGAILAHLARKLYRFFGLYVQGQVPF